ncbi:MAG TPA: Ig-like domain-containing protein, partial [Candidatus Saccharimonadales bacterium]|nr:Ig-like domain-containing protein [Candidatus Saccharimonadales bacterium]
TAVDLAYSLNDGSSWTNIATGLANSGTYAWPVPQSPTTQALVRVKAYDAATNMGSDVSNAVFTIADQTAPTIAVTSPNGGEAWAAGSSHNITWTATDNVGVTAVDLAYSLNGGSSWTNIATGLANSGTYSWSVPQSPTTQALVRATAHDGDGNATADASDAVFTIADQTAPTVTVTSPNGGESWDAGSSHNITWIASDNVGVDSVNVDYSLRGPGGPWVAIQHGLPNSGTLSWTLPVDSSDSALVQVVAFDHALNHTADPSDALFQIAGTAVGVPGGAAGRLYLARPAPNPSSGTVRLRYSLPAASPVRLEVLDVIGRQVWVREATQESAGGHFADWNGRSASGAPAAAGLYFVRLVTSGGALTQRLVRMR